MFFKVSLGMECALSMLCQDVVNLSFAKCSNNKINTF